MPASFPAAIATDADLLVAIDNAQTALSAAIGSGDTSLSVVSGAAIASNVVVTIDSEMILLGTVVGVNASGCTRGYGGTAAASHLIGAVVNVNVIAKHHNGLRDEVKAVQTALGVAMRYVRPTIRTSSYAFSIVPAQALTGAVLATVPLSPFPAGLTAASVGKHFLRITDGIGGNENVAVAGVNVGVSVSFTPALSHASGNWTLSTATAGIQEALYANAAGTPIMVPAGVHDLYRKAQYNDAIALFGEGRWETFIHAHTRNESCIESIFAGSGSAYASVHGMSFQPIGGAFTAGACVYLEGYTDGYLNNFTFKQAVRGIDWYAQAGGNPVQYDSIFNHDCSGVGIYMRSAGSGQVAGIMSRIYHDGTGSAAIQIDGTCGGLTLDGFFFQNHGYGLIFAPALGRPVNEIQVSNGIIDGPEIAGIYCLYAGSPADSSNGVSINHVLIAAGRPYSPNAYGMIIQNFNLVRVVDCTFRHISDNNAILLNGANFWDISANKFLCQTSATGACIRLTAASPNGRITGNRFIVGTADVVGIRLENAAHAKVLIDGNDFGDLTVPVSNASSSPVQFKGNSWPMYTPSMASAATVALPVANDDEVIAVSGTTNISQITGVPNGKQWRMLMAGALTILTGGANPGDSFAAFGPTTAGQIVLAYQNPATGKIHYK